jgi:FkbM family methyltransferase
MSKHFSQYNQDEFVDKVILRKKKNGFFVEIGAHDGISFSNTYFFEKYRNFDGLCIEPNPSVFTRLQQNRKCTVLNACISDSENTVNFLVIEGYAEMLSGIIDTYDPKHLERINNMIALEGGAKKEISVRSILLQNISFLHGKKIDYMSIDTEGNELNILQTIDFSKTKVNCLTIENNYDDKAIGEIMKSNNYVKIKRLGDDDVFIRKEDYNRKLEIRIYLFVYKRKFKHYFNKFFK